ncbi:hypothetical protein TI39_contig419g00006 [Zymoseptoria brevis]|uniref:Uncharacterized protein n=1 Tax=Zymoseptoria brevis TaxID=1047168 RepID=A0A0F4GLH8_9PEZI|nr:hypothetical protein TI39_contig419g00006 [Zymoseptoria brevis]
MDPDSPQSMNSHSSLGMASTSTETAPTTQPATAFAMPEGSTTSDAASSFAATWSSTDTAHLLPSKLPVAKVQRAWERRPQSPFSRRRVKVGKVWKRGGASSAAIGLGSTLASSSSSMFAFGGLGAAQQSPMRAVKKMRDAQGGATVSGWERRGSPTRERRIVTRSNAVEQDLVELGDEGEAEPMVGEVDMQVEEELQEEEVLKVEIENEDGTVLELDGEEAEAQIQDENWDDESMTEEEVWDATLMHLAQVDEEDAHELDVVDTSVHNLPAAVSTQLQETTTVSWAEIGTQIEDSSYPVDASHEAEQTTPEMVMSPSDVVAEPLIPAQKPTLRPAMQCALPEGFVSPVKGRQRRTINQVRLSSANRRRTLPVNFAAQKDPIVASVTANSEDKIVEPGTMLEPEQEISAAEAPDEATVQESDSDSQNASMGMEEAMHDAEAEKTSGDNEHDPEHEEEWEDIETEDQPVSENLQAQIAADAGFQEDLPQPQNADITDETTQTPTGSSRSATASPTRKSASPVAGTAGEHHLLAPRRSSRRQSTSPMKPSNILPSAQRPHLVAFTPIKMPSYKAPASQTPNQSPISQAMEIDDAAASKPVRSSSAPPEEPQMSPRRPKQPRISDDTALLQAFLHRAAESKTTKDVSTTAKRESIENRRDSGSVREALASPEERVVPSDVLADLDPNSPSPRKQFIAANAAESSRPEKEHIDLDEDELALHSPTRKTFRKSGRVKKQAQILPASAYSAPNRISIRGATDGVVLKKSEAQELALTTRTNTRKNKSGAVLPPMRLRSMAAEGLMGRTDTVYVEMDIEHPPGRRTVKWSETLVAFQEGANEPEISVLSDELGNEDGVDTEMVGVPSAPAPADTPSKPRLRRLKPPRTTASSAAAAKFNEAEVTSLPAEPKPKPRVQKRSSRIATPAKLKGAANSLLHFDPIEPDVVAPAEPKPQEAAASKGPVSRRKTTTTAPSKLRAPTSSSQTSLSASIAPVGKENSLIASPPKKRPGVAAKSNSTVAGLPSMKSLPPKLDFGSKNGNAGEMLGLSSPAKKKTGAKTVFAPQESLVSGKYESMSMPGMGSPAKKRTRRIGG